MCEYAIKKSKIFLHIHCLSIDILAKIFYLKKVIFSLICSLKKDKFYQTLGFSKFELFFFSNALGLAGLKAKVCQVLFPLIFKPTCIPRES